MPRTADDWRKLIPNKFYRGNGPRVNTVGKLIKALEELPPNLPVRCSFAKSVQVTVYNISKPDRHVEIE